MFTIDDIQNEIENYLIKINKNELVRSAIKYRYEKELAKNKYSELMKVIGDKVACKNVVNQNANLDEKSFGGRVGETTGLVMKQYALDYCMSPYIKNNHLNNMIYQHDLDNWTVGNHNCLTLPIDQLLENGFVTKQTDVRPAGSVNTAMQLVAVTMQLQSLQQFGGVSASHIDFTMVPFIRRSFSKYFVDVMNQQKPHWDSKKVPVYLAFDDPVYGKKRKYRKIYKAAMHFLVKEVHQAAEALFHNLNTLQSRSGNQLPFSSINLGLCTQPEGRLMTKEILTVCREGLGKYHRTSIFPCIIFQCKRNINRRPGDPNYDLFKLALQCTSERIYPNYGNCDWSTQEIWISEDRILKRRIIEELPKDKLAILKNRLEENPELCDILTLSKDCKPMIAEQPYEVFSTMGKCKL